MSSSHDRIRLSEQLQTSAPEIPQRLIRAHGTGVHSHHSQRQPAVREIHKNAWLRRVNPTEKKGAPFRKCDKVWVAFCVHDDVEAFLEFYPDPKVGSTHKPLSYVSLNNTQHVSSSIVGQDNEYQFAVTLPTQVIRLYAANWDQMLEWVESLQGKLRDMNILSPKDNLYSKLPESRPNNSFNSTSYPLSFSSGVISTRDPNSPLPPTPNGFSASESSRPAQPQLQLPHDHSTATGSQDEPAIYIEPSSALIERSLASGNSRRGCIFSSTFCATPLPGQPLSDDVPSNSSISVSDESVSPAATASFYVKPCSSFRDGSGSDSGNGSGGSIISLESRTISSIAAPHSSSAFTTPSNRSDNFDNEIIKHIPHVAVVTGNTTVVQVGCDEINSAKPAFTSATTQELTPQPSTFRFTEAPLLSRPLEAIPSTSTTSAPISVLYSVVNKQKSQKPQSSSQGTTVSSNGVGDRPPPAPSKDSNSSNSTVQHTKPSTAASTNLATEIEEQLLSIASIQTGLNSNASENIYEHLFLPESSTTQVKYQPIVISNGANGEAAPPIIPRRNPLPRRLHKPNTTANRSSSLTRLESAMQAGRSNVVRGCDSSCESSGNNRNRVREEASHQYTENGNRTDDSLQSLELPVNLEGRPMEAMIGVRSGEYRIRREELSGGGQSQCDSHSSSDGSSAANSVTNGTAVQIPLKEQQVIRLKAEINHSGGVRVVLRKKDCLSSIAFVDYLGAVWIAGWKQQEHPVLYYAFHVGDQILKVAGVSVQSSVEAYRAIKMVSSMQVEFIMRRLPYGRVFVLKRTREGEPLGLVALGNSGEIGEVISTGLAANQGLPLKSLATDGKTSCNWYLTEVNNRPLSLMARENEVRDRLNAVGKEISILVQPSDLVKHLRKNLKSLRGFKDYLIV